MYSNLIAKARNLLVRIHLRSSGATMAVKIIDIDEVFIEVIVRVNDKTGEFAANREEFESKQDGWREDRILINMHDISIIA